MNDEFIARLVSLRKEKGYTMKDMASKLKVPYSTYKSWENGASIKGHKRFVDISNTLGISIQKLMTGEDKTSIQKIEVCINSICTELENLKKDIQTLY